MCGTANILQEAPNPEANITAGCSRRLKVHLDDVVTICIILYNSDVFIDHAHWRSKNEKVMKTELLAFNTWSSSLLNEIKVTIDSPIAVLKLCMKYFCGVDSYRFTRQSDSCLYQLPTAFLCRARRTRAILYLQKLI